MFTVDVQVPPGTLSVEKLEKCLNAMKLTVKETGDVIILSRSALSKFISLHQVSLNGTVIKEKSVKVRALDDITIKIANYDQYKERRSANQKDNDAAAPILAKNRINKRPIVTSVTPTDIPLDVLYEDDAIAVINKPAGMLVQPSPVAPGQAVFEENQTQTLVNALVHKYGPSGLSLMGGVERPGIVHRLDKDTAGILVVARNDESHARMKEILQDHTASTIARAKAASLVGKKLGPGIEKKYMCVVIGVPKDAHGFIRHPIARHPQDRNKMVIDEKEGKESITEFRVVKVWRGVEIDVRVGKKSNATGAQKHDEYDNVISGMSTRRPATKSASAKPTSKFAPPSDDEADSADEAEDNESQGEESEDEEEALQVSKVDDKSSVAEQEQEYTIKKKKVGSGIYSLLEIVLHTGRTHQIRVHTSHEGYPIVGDPIYAAKTNEFLVPHLLLASVYLTFKHPMTSQQMEFTIDYPPHVRDFIASLDAGAKTAGPLKTFENQSTISASTTTIASSIKSTTLAPKKKKKSTTSTTSTSSKFSNLEEDNQDYSDDSDQEKKPTAVEAKPTKKKSAFASTPLPAPAPAKAKKQYVNSKEPNLEKEFMDDFFGKTPVSTKSKKR
eukprot:gene11525-13450_t